MDHLPVLLLRRRLIAAQQRPTRTILLDTYSVKLTLPLDPFGSNSTTLLAPEARPAMPSQAIESTDFESTANGRSELLLVCEARSTTLTDGYWRFALETADGVPVLDAEDIESGDLNRLTLLAAVRGLESIEGPSCVTLLSNNRYLIRSLSDSLPRWRQNDFVWEHFGRRIDVQHADLWRRVDRALQIHRVEACLVSSRLVSNGQTQENGTGHSSGAGNITRVDSAHSDSSSSSLVPPPKSRRRGSSSDDRLRTWLLSSSRSRGNAPVQRRFTSKDLVEECSR